MVCRWLRSMFFGVCANGGGTFIQGYNDPRSVPAAMQRPTQPHPGRTMAPWRLASQSEADLDESLESELVSSLESLLESLLLVEDSLPDELELELELEVEDAVVIEGT